MNYVKIQGFESLVKDTKSNAIVNTNKTDFQLYMKRIKERNQRGDKLRDVCKEINTIKKEFREIKSLLIKVLEK
tara:strand:- start:655 stop:876 length:222 start_codon:yes stop_codon:yes gene_type:complete